MSTAMLTERNSRLTLSMKAWSSMVPPTGDESWLLAKRPSTPEAVETMAPAGVRAPITPPTEAAVVVAAEVRPRPCGLPGWLASAAAGAAGDALHAEAPRASNSAMVCMSERQIWKSAKTDLSKGRTMTPRLDWPGLPTLQIRLC